MSNNLVENGDVKNFNDQVKRAELGKQIWENYLEERDGKYVDPKKAAELQAAYNKLDKEIRNYPQKREELEKREAMLSREQTKLYRDKIKKEAYELYEKNYSHGLKGLINKVLQKKPMKEKQIIQNYGAEALERVFSEYENAVQQRLDKVINQLMKNVPKTEEEKESINRIIENEKRAYQQDLNEIKIELDSALRGLELQNGIRGGRSR